MMADCPKILVCPLDWGLGHATRCIPIIRHLISSGYSVEIAGYGNSLIVLKNEFPQLLSHQLPGFNVRYTKRWPLWLGLLPQLPSYFYHYWREHQSLKKLAKQVKPDIILSDNRYGLFLKKTKSIIVTHQLNPILPIVLRPFAPLVHLAIRRLVQRFDQCLIPDFVHEPRLTGLLNKDAAKLKNCSFIGLLSRFSKENNALSHIFPKIKNASLQNLQITIPLQISNDIDLPNEPFLLAVVSGPEPQRTIFANLVRTELSKIPLPCIIVEGLPNLPFSVHQQGNLITVPHIDSNTLQKLIIHCQMVICRCGYTSVMDLHCLGQKAILIPTPGQSEQLYLSKSLYENGLFYTTKQRHFTVSEALPSALNFYSKA